MVRCRRSRRWICMKEKNSRFCSAGKKATYVLVQTSFFVGIDSSHLAIFLLRLLKNKLKNACIRKMASTPRAVKLLF
jgi:hypothetical protein